MTGKIISIKDGNAEIEIICAEMPDKQKCFQGCSGCKFFAKKHNNPNIITAKNDVNAAIEQLVEVQLKEGIKLKGTILLFAVPLLVFLVVVGFLTYFKITAVVAFVTGVAAIAVTLLLLKALLKNKTFYYITNIKEIK